MCAQIWMFYRCSMLYAWCCNLTHYFAVQIHYLLSCWPWLDKHTARTFALLAAYVLEFDTCDWCSLQYEVVSYPPHVLSKTCTIMAVTPLRWSSLLKCMKWASCWPCTNRTYVCIAACVLELEHVIDVRSSTYNNVVVFSCTLMSYFAV